MSERERSERGAPLRPRVTAARRSSAAAPGSDCLRVPAARSSRSPTCRPSRVSSSKTGGCGLTCPCSVTAAECCSSEPPPHATLTTSSPCSAMIGQGDATASVVPSPSAPSLL
eukprot:768683-Hanusia_phi.AAC.6